MTPLITKRLFLTLDRFGSDKEPYRNQSIRHEIFHNAKIMRTFHFRRRLVPIRGLIGTNALRDLDPHADDDKHC